MTQKTITKSRKAETADAIQALLNGTEWSSDTLQAIAEVMRDAGYEVKDFFYASAPVGGLTNVNH